MMIKPIYTLEKHLEAYCRIDNRYIQLKNIYDFNKDIICDALKQINRYFSSYSNHDDTHSEAIIASIESLLGEERISFLSPTDTFLILLSAYLHDISMNINYDKVKELVGSDKFKEFLYEIKENRDYKKYAEYFLDEDYSNEFFKSKTWKIETIHYVNTVISEYYRRNHGENSKKIIQDGFKNYDIILNPNKKIRERIFEVLGEITRLHGSDFNEVLKMDQEAEGAFNDKIHPRFIAILIRIGDLLDLDNNRFNEDLIKSVYGESLPEMNKIHYDKHKSIKSFLIKPEEIHIVATSKKDKVIRETKKWVKWLEDEINNLTKYWNQIIPPGFPGAAPKLTATVTKSNSEDKFKEENLQLNFSAEKAFDIIQGANIYKDNLIFIREFLQNSLDAIKIQFWNDIKHDERFIVKNSENVVDIEETKERLTRDYYDGKLNDYIERYSIKVKIFDCENEDELLKLETYFNSTSFNESLKDNFKNNMVIVFEDNGTGISQDNFIERLINVGKKKNGGNYRKNIDRMPNFLKPTGEFGIGLQSAFLVSDSIIIQTKTVYDNCFGREIIIESGVRDGFVQCNELSLKDEEKFLPKSYTKVFIPLNKSKLEVDTQESGIGTKYTFPFEVNHKQFINYHIQQKIINYISEPIFEITLNEAGIYNNRNFRRIMKAEFLKEFKYDRYYIRIYKEPDVVVIDKLTGDTLILHLKSKDEEKNIQALYKGIKINNSVLIQRLKNYILEGTDVTINYHFDKTSKYLKINRDDVTQTGLRECEKIFKNHMDIAIKFLSTYLIKKYETDIEEEEIKSYLYVSKNIGTISKKIVEMFEWYLEEYKTKKADVNINKLFSENNFRNVFSLFDEEKQISYLLEVLIKRITNEIWDKGNIKKYDEEYSIKERNILCEFIAGLLNYNLDKKEIEYLVNLYEIKSETISTEFISDMFNSLIIEICNFESEFFYKTNLLKNRNHLKKHFKEYIPTTLLFLYNIKYAQEEFLNNNSYKDLLEVLSDYYIPIKIHKAYKQRGLKPMYFGREIISEYESMFRFLYEPEDLTAIYPIKKLDIEEHGYPVVNINYERCSVDSPVFIQYNSSDIFLVKYLFDGVIDGKIGSEYGFNYFNSWNIYCIPAIDKFKQISVNKMPFEFESFYKNSKFKNIHQENYIMLPLTPKILQEFEEFIEEEIFYGSKLTHYDEFVTDRFTGAFFNFVQESILDKNFLKDIKVSEIKNDRNEDFKTLLELCKNITNTFNAFLDEYKKQEQFKNIVEYTITNASLKFNYIDDSEIRDRVSDEYCNLIREVFVYLIEYLF